MNVTISPANESLNDFLANGTDSLSDENAIGGTYPLSTVQLVFRYLQMSTGWIGVVLNMFALLLMLKVVKKEKGASDILTISQLVIDLISSFVISLIYPTNLIIPAYFHNNFPYEALCRMWYAKFIPFFFTNMSMFNLVFLAIERYLKISIT